MPASAHESLVAAREPLSSLKGSAYAVVRNTAVIGGRSPAAARTDQPVLAEGFVAWTARTRKTPRLHAGEKRVGAATTGRAPIDETVASIGSCHTGQMARPDLGPRLVDSVAIMWSRVGGHTG